MNSWKFNGIAGCVTRNIICKELNINPSDLYKKVKNITTDGTVTTNEDEVFQFKLEQIIKNNKNR